MSQQLALRNDILSNFYVSMPLHKRANRRLYRPTLINKMNINKFILFSEFLVTNKYTFFFAFYIINFANRKIIRSFPVK